MLTHSRMKIRVWRRRIEKVPPLPPLLPFPLISLRFSVEAPTASASSVPPRMSAFVWSVAITVPTAMVPRRRGNEAPRDRRRQPFCRRRRWRRTTHRSRGGTGVLLPKSPARQGQRDDSVVAWKKVRMSAWCGLGVADDARSRTRLLVWGWR